MEIMFEDLTPDAQKRLLEAAAVARPEDMDWDELPVAVVEFETEEFYMEDDEEDEEFVDDVDVDNMYDEDEF